MMAIINIVALIALFFWLRKKFPEPIFTIGLLVKVLAGIGLGFLYQHYYTSGDTWTFFADAKHAAAMLRANPGELLNFFWFDDWSKVSQPLGSSGLNPLFMVKWVAFFNLITGDNYWLASTYLSLLSFAGAWILYRSIGSCFPTVKREAALAILFIPSVIFWGSGVIKECLALGALFGLSAYFIQWYVRAEIKIVNVVVALISLWILWYLKYYWLAVWLAVVIPLIVVKLVSTRSNWVKQHTAVCWIIFFLLAVIGISVLHPNFYYYRILSVVVDNYNAYIQISSPEDVIRFSSLEPTLLSMVKNAPWAVVSGFFRPFVWEASTLFQIASGLESLVLLGLFVMALVRFKNWLPRFNELHLAILFYLIILAALLALSTPNFGSLSRYRIGFTPFLWLLVLVTSGIGQYLPKRVQNLLDSAL
jgi:hypothetical protein